MKLTMSSIICCKVCNSSKKPIDSKGCEYWHYFERDRSSPLCKSCYNKQYRKSHLKKCRQAGNIASKLYYELNSEKCNQATKKWRQSNRMKVSEYNKNYYKLNPEYHKTRSKNWRVKNTEQYLSYARNYAKLHPDVGLRTKTKKLKQLGVFFNKTQYQFRWAIYSWAHTVKNRDGLTCQNCGVTDKTHKLVAHHLFYQANYPELSLNSNNGITLCVSCHKELHYAITNLEMMEVHARNEEEKDILAKPPPVATKKTEEKETVVKV